MYIYKNFQGTIPEIIEHFNLDLKRKTIYDRIERGMSIAQAIEKTIRSYNIYEYKGFKGTVPDIINHFNLDIKRKTVYDRLSKGMSIEQAIEFPLNYNKTTRKL